LTIGPAIFGIDCCFTLRIEYAGRYGAGKYTIAEHHDFDKKGNSRGALPQVFQCPGQDRGHYEKNNDEITGLGNNEKIDAASRDEAKNQDCVDPGGPLSEEKNNRQKGQHDGADRIAD